MRLTRALRVAILFVAMLIPVSASAAQTPDQALDAILDNARASLPEACGDPASGTLVRILCTGEIRVGVRANYPLFATSNGGERIGYDVDVARAVAARLEVGIEWVRVRAATRIAILAEGRADLVVATMGHNARRDAQARFIRPHYYSSQTIVVGPDRADVRSLADLAGRSMCVTLGNYSNAHIVSLGARLMLFDDASRLPHGLIDESCQLAAQDNSFFASYLADPDFGDRFEVKFGFDAVPWGMAVARTGSEELAAVLDLLSQIMHRDGVFLEIARKHGIFTAFLEDQHALWQEPRCAAASAVQDERCVLPPLVSTPEPTSFAPRVEASLGWLRGQFGLDLSLPMLMTEPAWQLFRAGIVNSLILVIGTIAATLALSLAFGAAFASSSLALRAPAWFVIVTLQSSPVILTLVIAASIAQVLFGYSAMVALGSAIVALGLMNGCNAAQAIGEAAHGLRRRHGLPAKLSWPLYKSALRRSITQILSFLVNAAKGTPIASFTGAPELLSALTEITSFASARAATYTTVLIFYVVVVIVVVWACEKAKTRLEATMPTG